MLCLVKTSYLADLNMSQKPLFIIFCLKRKKFGRKQVNLHLNNEDSNELWMTKTESWQNFNTFNEEKWTWFRNQLYKRFMKSDQRNETLKASPSLLHIKTEYSYQNTNSMMKRGLWLAFDQGLYSLWAREDQSNDTKRTRPYIREKALRKRNENDWERWEIQENH